MAHSLRLELADGELLVLQLARRCQLFARSGAHWLTIDGQDICLHDGETVDLPAGKLLLEGRGQLELRLCAEQAAAQHAWLSLGSHYQTV
ncbi:MULTISPECIES: DUF2917 domain-containing protein [Aquitalea]|uniref:DUF2917 family protein n=1 Tax=Aquitalea magnusonii TaxID=332411 RepID=A0A318JA45_9NEIS|nr:MULTISPECIES: DUF2917 domain-containing protein [Aquitalea]PXX43437.1 hypothetical protein DFR38_11565 [Aquitalea magnusonii]